DQPDSQMLHFYAPRTALKLVAVASSRRCQKEAANKGAEWRVDIQKNVQTVQRQQRHQKQKVTETGPISASRRSCSSPPTSCVRTLSRPTRSTNAFHA